MCVLYIKTIYLSTAIRNPPKRVLVWLFYKAFPAPLVLVVYTNATLAVERAVNLTPRPAVTVTEPDFVDVFAFTLFCFFDRVPPILTASTLPCCLL